MDRYQRVAIKDKTNSTNYSDWELIKHGVPQGSILGPLFFLLYINYLPTITAKNAKVMLYANDTSLVINSASPILFVNKLNTVFADVNEWFRNNLLSLNLKKLHTYSFEQRIVKQQIQKLYC